MKNRLASIRASAGLTQKDIAKACGIPDTSIAHYESGRRNPNLRNALRIARALSTYGQVVFIEDIWEE